MLTCAHNFYHKRQRVENSLFSIYPGQSGLLEKAYKIEAIYIPDEYAQAQMNKAIEFDYALVKLTEKVKSAGYLPLKGNF